MMVMTNYSNGSRKYLPKIHNTKFYSFYSFSFKIFNAPLHSFKTSGLDL